MMNSFDFLIIYLTCGAPLGVFYFLQNRKKQIGIRLWLKTFFTFIFWLPFGIQLLKQNKVYKKLSADKKAFSKTGNSEIKIFLYQKQFEEVCQKSNLQMSIFEFREVLERYVGLTIAQNCENSKITKTEKEIFGIAGGENIEIGVICLNRRNLKRLTFHQIQAQQDFLQIISQLVAVAPDRREFVKFAANFFRLLNDTEAQLTLEKVSSDNLQTERGFTVNRSENYLWNTETHKPLSASPTTLHLQTSAATTNSSARD